MRNTGRPGEYHIPVSTTPGYTPPPPLRRHNTARYYAHRVKDSFTNQMSKLICTIFLGLLLIVGIITFILWLSLRPHRPRFHIEDFSIAPDLAQAGLVNVPIVFNATARNPNMNIGVFYDAMQVTCYYKDQGIGSTTLIYPFYQEPKNTTLLFGTIPGNSTITVQWPAAFRMEFTSMIKFKISSWNSKHHKMHANCEFSVGPEGKILPEFKDKRCPVYFT